jgi:Tfp pilus assembly protein PilN
MIQLNLLPNVKYNYIKIQRKKRMVLLSVIAISGVSLGIVVILASIVYGAQKVQLNLLDKNVKNNISKLQKIDELDKILTIQNQLNSLPGLHSQKPVTSRLFDFLPQITPVDVQMSNLKLSFDDSTLQITGIAKSLEAVNKFVDTLKFTDYATDKTTDKKRAFSEVVLTSFGRNDKEATYIVKMKFDPVIFSSDAKTVSLVVPNITSTRSQTEQPDIFKAQPTGSTDNNGSTN